MSGIRGALPRGLGPCPRGVARTAEKAGADLREADREARRDTEV